MFKRIIVLSVLLMYVVVSFATEQYPDKIIYKGKTYELSIGWGHPSPLQVLYIRTNTTSPFHSYSTANYRGHIATWEIRNNRLFLVNVDTRTHRGRTGTYWPTGEKQFDTLASPSYYSISSLSNCPADRDGAVLADWFSGVLEVGAPISDGKKKAKMKGLRYIYVRDGEIVDDQIITNNDFKRFERMTAKDTSNHKLMDKYLIVYLNQCYISFYFQSGMANDAVLFDGHKGRLPSADFRPTLMSLYDNDPLLFPYNWEHFEKNGTPVCTWSIRHDSLFLDTVRLFSGLGFYEHNEELASLEEMFIPERIENGRVFAFWMNGEKYVEYGKSTQNGFGREDFRLTHLQHIILDSGRIVNVTWTPSDFEGDTLKPLQVCDSLQIYGKKNWAIRDLFGELPEPATLPIWKTGDSTLQAWFDSHPLQDERADSVSFRVNIAFKVNCNGEAGDWTIASKGASGVFFELANQILDILRQLPNNWLAATNDSGEPVDCWHVMSISVENKHLSCKLLE